MYSGGLGVDKSSKIAAEWFESGGAATKPLHNTWCDPKVAKRHRRNLKQSVRRLLSPLMLSQKVYGSTEDNLHRKLTEKLPIFANAALGGNKTAHYYIGLMLDYGQGLQPNPEKAENYLVSARDGFARAQFNLGFLSLAAALARLQPKLTFGTPLRAKTVWKGYPNS